MSTAKVICLYTTDEYDAALELAARMLDLTTPRRGSKGAELAGNKSALVKVMTAAVLEAAIFACEDKKLVAEARRRLHDIDVGIKTEDGRIMRLSSSVNTCIPHIVDGKLTVQPRYRYVPVKGKPGYERKVVL